MIKRQPNQTEPIKLLLVDDEEGYVNVLTKRLSRRNIDVTPALSAGDAVRILRDKDFDVAVLDLKMGDMDGIEALKIFKKLYPPMEVIMLTGHGSQKAASDGLKLGAFDYLTKPCDLEDLLAKINDAYRKKVSSV
ncbi:MAG: response regulator [Pseudomonadota bacterium]